MNEYKELLILHYFENAGASYSYKELLEIFGLLDEQLQLILKDLLEKDLLKIDGYFKLTKMGLKKLEDHGLDQTDYNNIDVEKENIFSEISMDFSEIYIPKRFNKKFK